MSTEISDATIDAVWVNGSSYAAIDPRDRGLLYGDGVFRTFRINSGQVIQLERGIHHLLEDCRQIDIREPSELLLRNEISQAAHGIESAVLRYSITRGVGARGYRPDPNSVATRIAWRSPPASTGHNLLKRGINARWCSTPLGINPVLAGIKSLNRLEQVMARSECSDSEIHEGLMCSPDGQVICGTMSNLFWVRNGGLLTPCLDRAGVRGSMRGLIMEQAQSLGLSVNEVEADRADVERADELFVSNAVIGLWPITRLDNRRYPIGDVTNNISKALEIDKIYL